MTTQETLLVALRGRFGDSQTAIAEATGMSLSRLNNYIRGTRKMDDDAVIACCELLGWNAQKYVAAHRAETATTKREISFWRKLAGGAAAAVVMLSATTLPVRVEKGAQERVQAQAAPHFAESGRGMHIMSARRGFLTVMQDVFLWLRWKFSGKVAGPHLEAMTA